MLYTNTHTKVDAFFLEMDVWLLRNPLPLFHAATEAHSIASSSSAGSSQGEETQGGGAQGGGAQGGTVSQRPDVVISVHQENYMDLNAG
jgi:hypothetical protein